MTKTQEILKYHTMHPDAPARDIVLGLGHSRQLVSAVLKRRGLRATPVEYEVNRLGPTCKYCGKEVRSWTWDKKIRKHIRCRYHSKCAWKTMRYRGECPVCGKHFERARSKVGRNLYGRPTSGIVVCSNPCRFEALRLGLYPQNHRGRPRNESRTT